MMNRENDVILAVLKLSRALRRCPPDSGKSPFPPAVGRLLESIADNSNVSSRELCEMLDVRPSSLSEMLSRAESEGWVLRTVDEEDRRVQRLTLSDKGKEAIDNMTKAREADYERKTACFTDEEKVQFCALSNRLSDHIESLAAENPDLVRQRPPHGRPPFPPEGGCSDGPHRPGRPPFPPEGGCSDGPHRPGRPPFPPEGECSDGHHRPGHPPVPTEDALRGESEGPGNGKPSLPPDARIKC